eukprot:gb/GECG01012332.1/.p1 GENE.gb/GECG01012332.1/~~gb/GECG01012332.1/.p1  ORF type:complete len:192 (+),score=18.76 gb/GECG01012332.1/:1-576(+)
MSASGNDPPDWVESGGLFGGDDDVQGDTPAMRDNIMFLIDSREGMFKHKNDEGKTVFENCVRATLDFVKAKIIAGADDKVGVILMGTKEQNTRDNFEGVYVLSHLMQPGIETVQDLEVSFRCYYPTGIPFADRSKDCYMYVSPVRSLSLVHRDCCLYPTTTILIPNWGTLVKESHSRSTKLYGHAPQSFPL